jgi:hypothetical protein
MNIDTRDIEPTSFSPDCGNDSGGTSIGQDFLTWLWFYSETRGGIIKTGCGDFAAMIEGPLTFVSEGQGAHEVVIRRGTPEISTEAKIALISGKKLSRARLMLARGQDTWQVQIDADQFIFRGLKLPEGEQLEPISRFQERMTAISTFTTAFFETYERFVLCRVNAAEWLKTQGEIIQWVSDRTARK